MGKEIQSRSTPCPLSIRSRHLRFPSPVSSDPHGTTQDVLGSHSARRVGLERGKIMGRSTCFAISLQTYPTPSVPLHETRPRTHLLVECSSHSTAPDQDSRLRLLDDLQQSNPFLLASVPFDLISIAHKVLHSWSEVLVRSGEETWTIEDPVQGVSRDRSDGNGGRTRNASSLPQM